MPTDVLARIEAALAEQPAADLETDLQTQSLPDEGEPPTRLEVARERRKGRFAVLLAAAAVVAIVVVGGGVVVQQLVPVALPKNMSATGSGDSRPNGGAGTSKQPQSAPKPLAAGRVQVVASGRDWTDEQLPTLGRTAASGTADTGRSHADQAKAAPEPLPRFANPAVLQACLEALGRLGGGEPTYVDLALFDGGPAVPRGAVERFDPEGGRGHF
ncbi:hypothetical protein [Fodinicola feengrottensis]|uniref:hypothetical protein n=1 Tax=Fodinicola feengrottensis TaxID=435914 RepID=UPI0013D55672|nr:hypothetical protein [Fodinicola feengrottensis]